MATIIVAISFADGFRPVLSGLTLLRATIFVMRGIDGAAGDPRANLTGRT